MNIGILTAGGVCPGVNTLIRSITLREKNQGNRVYGFSDGFRGLNNNTREYFNQEYIDEGPGTILRTSHDTVDVARVVENLLDFDRLYCICGNESMSSAKALAMDKRVGTNIIGIAKTVFNDIPGIESVGFQTAVQELARYIDCAYIEAQSTNSIVFLIVPGRNNTKLATYAGLARNSKVTNIITPGMKTNSKDCIEYSYMSRGYALVIVSEMAEIPGPFENSKIISPGYLIRDVEPCAYDSILAERMVKEAFYHAQENRDFIKGATNIVAFKDYLRVV